MYTLADSLKNFDPVINFTRLLSRRTLRFLRYTFFTIAIAAGLASTGLLVFLPDINPSLLSSITIIAFALWVEQMMLASYQNSYYYFGLNSVVGLENLKISGATYEVAESLRSTSEDITQAFCISRLGTAIMLRAGVAPLALDAFLAGARPKISTAMVPLTEGEIFTFITLGKFLLQHDPAFKNFLKEQGISEENFQGALVWVVGAHHTEKKRERWWGKDNLSKSKGIGRDWSYGTPYLLEKFSRDIRTSAVFSTLTNTNTAFTEAKLVEIETALARAKSANVLVLGEAGVGKIDLIMAVDKRLQAGYSIGAVAEQKMVLLDSTRLFAVNSEKQDLEITLIALFNEAITAGNIIIVIENLSVFVREAEALGVFIPELLDPYLASPAMHVIATDTPGAYHTYLEPLGAFARRFSEVLVDTPDLSSTTRVLESIALQNENRYRLLFTYASLAAITSAADRYLIEGVMPDKAIELLLDVATRANQANQTIVTADYVYQVVSDKTGIPVGPIGAGERELLLHLEDKLHERVIGQDRAIDAIARAMRRARAGIQSAEKPIGSFLFLGPTGVGKTETAKALAYIFFGSETSMQRIDMSEFSGEDALPRLIGDGVKSGVLSDMLRESPYSVLLLDEFEKGAKTVHDIFLQILDEGVFTDARGDKVNARNTIIIATSNAGSQLIMRTVEQRKDLAILTQEIINHIVAEGTYRPELLNRFDSTIIFEPLTLEEQGKIASLMLGGLYERIKERGYELTINRDLMDLMVKKGYNPEFGARPMQRVLQDLLEEKIAQYIIGGQVQKGDTIALSLADFSETELAV